MKLGYFSLTLITSTILWFATARLSDSCQDATCCLTCCTATHPRLRWSFSEKWCKHGCRTENCDELLSSRDFQSCSIGLSFRNGDVVSWKRTESSCCAGTGVHLESEECKRFEFVSFSSKSQPNSSPISVITDVVNNMHLFFWSVVALGVLVIIETMFFKYMGRAFPWKFPRCFDCPCGLNAAKHWLSWRCLAYWFPDIWFWPVFYFVSFVLVPVLIALTLIFVAFPVSSMFTFIHCMEGDVWLENLVNVALWLGVYYFSCLPITTAVDFLQAFISNPEHDCWYSVLPIDFHRRIHVQLGFCGSVCLITGYIGFLKCKTNVEDQEAQILETAVNLIPLILMVHFGGRGLLLLYSFSFLSAAIPLNPILWFAHLATGISILVLLGLLNFLAGLLLGFTWLIFFLDSKNPSFCDPFTSISGKNRFHCIRCWMVCSRRYHDNE